MEVLFSRFQELFQLNWSAAINWLDIVLVTILIYKILTMIKGARAWRIVGGICIFIAALWISGLMGLTTLNWILDKALLLLPVALVILLLPELRQMLEGIGALGGTLQKLGFHDEVLPIGTVENLVQASKTLAEDKIGALIVIEREQKVGDFVSAGVPLDAEVSAPLLVSIFFGGNPLHDGAVIVRNNRIVRAACQLPMSTSSSLSGSMHMRHRAGLGISEETDAVVIIISEEQGKIRVAMEGEILNINSENELRQLLLRELHAGRDGEDGGDTAKKRRERRLLSKRMASKKTDTTSDETLPEEGSAESDDERAEEKSVA
ncbi:MAG: diadenylate cyclase CdaA [Fimbriimonadaceae bacterium]